MDQSKLDNKANTVTLDWSRLLGFDQAPASGNDAAAKAGDLGCKKLGAKIGNAKPGILNQRSRA